jgi:hypothetical protein
VTRLEPIPDDDNPVGAVPIRQWLRDFDIRIRDHTDILADADVMRRPIDAAAAPTTGPTTWRRGHARPASSGGISMRASSWNVWRSAQPGGVA